MEGTGEFELVQWEGHKKGTDARLCYLRKEEYPVAGRFQRVLRDRRREGESQLAGMLTAGPASGASTFIPALWNSDESSMKGLGIESSLGLGARAKETQNGLNEVGGKVHAVVPIEGEYE